MDENTKMRDELDHWDGSGSQNIQSKTYIFFTEDRYVDRDIEFTVNVPGIELRHGESFYIKGPVGPTFVWHCDELTGEITITGSDE